MWGLATQRRLNEEQAARELATIRAMTVRGLRHAHALGGIAGVLRLLTEALGESKG